MNAEYKRDLQNNYLILEAPGAEEDDYRLRMAEQNQVSGLLPFHSARKDGVLYLHYEITSRQTLESIFEKRKMGYEDIFFLLAGIRDVLEAMQRYLLDPSQLVFEPEYVYVDPDRRKVQLCYLPGSAGNYPITLLAEFILKKLDHREQQAVVLGYGFYQKAMEENFSLQKTLREILETGEMQESGAEMRGAGGNDALPCRDRLTVEKEAAAGRRRETGNHREYAEKDSAGYPYESAGRFDRDEREEVQEDRESYEVTHRERRKRPQGVADRVFQVIHPAVLLSTLLLLALLEIVYYFGMLTVTEAGGVFFLVISAEALANKFWRNSREKKKENRWVAEEDDEMYRMLREEMYEPPETSTVGETRCLTPGPEQTGIYLVCTRGGAGGIAGQDIFVGSSPVYVGKIRGESDVILDSPTVSRRHARLECRDGVCYVKDLNSRNGTFCNGRRLRPQEQCQFTQGDEISFAEIGYRAVLR